MTDNGRHYTKGSGEKYGKNIMTEYVDEYTRKAREAEKINSKVQRPKPDRIQTKGSPGTFTTEKMIAHYPKEIFESSPMKNIDNLKPIGKVDGLAKPGTEYGNMTEGTCGPTFSPMKNREKRKVPENKTACDSEYKEEYKNKNKQFGADPVEKYTSPNKYNDFVKKQRDDVNKNYTPSKFGYAGITSESKDQYVPKEISKVSKGKDMRTGSIRKPGYGTYETQYHDEYVPYESPTKDRDDDHKLSGNWRHTSQSGK